MLSRKMYFAKQFENADGNISSSWKVIKEAMQYQKKTPKCDIKHEGRTL